MSKLTLKEAIAAGNDEGSLKVTDGGREMVLERQVFPSRKGGKVSVVSKGVERLQKKSKGHDGSATKKERDEVQDTATSLSNEAKQWRMAYMNLKKEQFAEKKILKMVEVLLSN